MKKKVKSSNKSLLVFSGFLIFFISCSQLSKLQKRLPPEDQDFLSKVRYIINRQERKAFLNMSTNEQRKQFIKEFWKKRDPEPDTDENIYKETYFNRINETNKLFASEGKNGWLTDRGRTYIMLGPPDRRNVYPQGITFYGPAAEIWYYGFFPIVFLDPHRNGIYKINYQNSASYIQLINNAEMILNPAISYVQNFDMDVKANTSKRGKVIIQVRVPYKKISFVEKKKKFIANLELLIDISTLSKEKVKHLKKSYQISLTNDDLNQLELNYLIEEEVDLSPGEYFLNITLDDRYGDNRIEKILNVKVK